MRPQPIGVRRHSSDTLPLGLVPVLLTLHNIEEALAVSRLEELQALTPSALRALLPEFGAADYLVALGLLSAAAFVVTWWGGAARPGTRRGYALVALQATMLLNAGVHVASSLRLGTAGPGLLTGVAVNLPFSVFLLRRAVREEWHRPPFLASLVPLALVLHGPGLLVLLFLSRWVATAAAM